MVTRGFEIDTSLVNFRLLGTFFYSQTGGINMTNLAHYDIVGSFLRPQELKQARADFEAGRIDAAALKAVEDQAIKDLVAKEEASGLLVVTDGELRRSYWHLDTFWGFAGIEHIVRKHGYFFHDEETRPDSARVVGKIAFAGTHPDLEAFKFLKQLTAGTNLTARQSIPAPAQLYAELVRGPENVAALRKVYESDDELFTDISNAYRDLILALYEAGCRDVKLDDCTWGMVVDDRYWEQRDETEFDRDALQEIYLRLNNEALRDLPADLRVSTHICRGNYHSTWAAKGGYQVVADHVFAEENVSDFYLEFDDERSGDFKPLAAIPAGKRVVLGLVTSKRPELEDKATLKKRIEEASQYVSLENLALSTQCGFASTEEGNILTEEEQWQKIKLVIETAKEVWGN